MEQHPFDRLARALAVPQSRRGVLRTLGGSIAVAAVGALLPLAQRGEADTPCDPGLVRCAGACVDLLSDPANCGACGQHVPVGGTCSNGTVQTPPQNAPKPPPPSTPPATPPPAPTPPLLVPAPTPPAPSTCAGLGQECSASLPCCQASQGLFGQNGAQICSSEGLCSCNTSAGFSACAGQGAGPICCAPGEICCTAGGVSICVSRAGCCNGVLCDPREGRSCINGQCVCKATGVAPCLNAFGGFQCCDAGEHCLPGQGCSCTVDGIPGIICGSGVCCAAPASCSSHGGCACPPNRESCLSVCCAVGEVCCGGNCYPAGTAACLSANQAAITCCAPGTTCCSGASQVVCCQPGASCQNGQCVATCNSVSPCTQPGTCCAGSACVPTAQCPGGSCCTNGVCGCPSGQTCENGACVGTCDAAHPCTAGTCCNNGVCVPPAQCPGGGCCTSGVCGCTSGQTCQSGVCQTGCPTGYTPCIPVGGAPVYCVSSPAYCCPCPACGNPFPGTFLCSIGTQQCPPAGQFGCVSA